MTRSQNHAVAHATTTTPTASGAIQFGWGVSVRKIEDEHAISARPANGARRGAWPYSQGMIAFAAGCGSASPTKSVLESTRIEYQIDNAQVASTNAVSRCCCRSARISRVCLT